MAVSAVASVLYFVAKLEGGTPIGLISLRKGEAEVGLSKIRKSRIDARKSINSNSVGLGCA